MNGLAAGIAARDAGLEQAANARRELLRFAQECAERVARGREDRTATADDVQQMLRNYGYRPRDLGNAAGKIFLTSRWDFTGQWKRSERSSNHARAIRIWRLSETQSLSAGTNQRIPQSTQNTGPRTGPQGENK